MSPNPLADLAIKRFKAFLFPLIWNDSRYEEWVKVKRLGMETSFKDAINKLLSGIVWLFNEPKESASNASLEYCVSCGCFIQMKQARRSGRVKKGWQRCSWIISGEFILNFLRSVIPISVVDLASGAPDNPLVFLATPKNKAQWRVTTLDTCWRSQPFATSLWMVSISNGNARSKQTKIDWIKKFQFFTRRASSIQQWILMMRCMM